MPLKKKDKDFGREVKRNLWDMRSDLNGVFQAIEILRNHCDKKDLPAQDVKYLLTLALQRREKVFRGLKEISLNSRLASVFAEDRKKEKLKNDGKLAEYSLLI